MSLYVVAWLLGGGGVTPGWNPGSVCSPVALCKLSIEESQLLICKMGIITVPAF